MTRDFLSEAEEFEFHLDWIDNFQAGLNEITKNQHDVYLLDYRLGKENGLELLQAAIAIGCQRPIILLTGLGDREIDQQAMESGASDYSIHQPWIVAMTAHAASEAREICFQAGMNDYVCKPVQLEDLATAMLKSNRL